MNYWIIAIACAAFFLGVAFVIIWGLDARRANKVADDETRLDTDPHD